MSDELDETYPLTLGDRRWELPNFKFGVIRRLQPRLLRLNRELAKDGLDQIGFRLDEKAIEEMLGVVADAIHVVDPEIARESLDDLFFTPMDLVAAQTAVMRACRLIRRAAPGVGGEGDPDPKA